MLNYDMVSARMLIVYIERDMFCHTTWGNWFCAFTTHPEGAVGSQRTVPGDQLQIQVHWSGVQTRRLTKHTNPDGPRRPFIL